MEEWPTVPRETFRQSYLDVVRCPPGISLSLPLCQKQLEENDCYYCYRQTCL